MKLLTVFVLLVLCAKVYAGSEEVEAAKEGAPSHISDGSRVMVWKNGKYATAVEGTNGFVCLMWADQQGTFEPSCFNQAAMEAVFPVYQFQRNLLETGVGIEDIHRQIAQKAQSGEFPPPKPGAVVYMLSKRNKYFDHFGQRLLDIEPHIMLYLPKVEAGSIGFNGQNGLPSFYSDFPHLSVVHIHESGNHH